MRILFNDLILLRQKSGIGIYAEQILENLTEDIEVIRLSELLPARPLHRIFSAAGVGGETRPSLLGALKKRGHDLLNLYLATAVNLRPRWDLYHEPDTLPLAIKSPVVTTVHDLSVTLFPQWHPEHRVKKFSRHLESALARTTRFVAVSRHTKDEMVKHWRVPAEKIDVIYEAPRAQFSPADRTAIESARRRFGLPQKYLLFVGNLEPRKNIGGLIAGYENLPASLRARVKLVLVGGDGWKTDAVAKKVAELRDSIIRLGYLGDGDLVDVMSGASALVYPSFYEGFGLPPLEAMACDVPVVSSAAGSLAEVLGDAAAFVDPANPASIAEKLEHVLTDESFGRSLVEKGRAQIKRFSWEKAGRATSDLYHQLFDGRR